MDKQINAVLKIKMAIVLSIVGIAFASFFNPEPISSRIEKEKFWADKVHSAKKYNIVFCGDSRIYRCISTEAISRELLPLELDVLNYGFSSGGHNKEMFLAAEKKLVTSTEIKAIVLGITPYSLTPKGQANAHFKQETNRDWTDIFSRRFLYPAFRFFEPTSPMEIIDHITSNQTGYHEKFIEGGWVKSYKIPEEKESALKSYSKQFKNNIVNNNFVSNLGKQVLAWEKAGIQVFAFRVPSSIEMENLENSISGYSNERVRKAIEISGGEWLLIPNKGSYHSYDGSHLHHNSAVLLSEELGKQLKSKLGQSN